MICFLPYDDYKNNHAEHDGANNDHEIKDFPFQRSQTNLGCVGHLCNFAEDCGIASRNNYAYTAASNTVSALHTDALCLEVIVICAVDRTLEWKRLAYHLLTLVILGAIVNLTSKNGAIKLCV